MFNKITYLLILLRRT